MSGSDTVSGDDPRVYEHTYISGRLATKTRFHIFEDCHYIRDKDTREPSVGALLHHNLKVCPDCQRRDLTTVPQQVNSEVDVFKTCVYLTQTEHDVLEKMVKQNIVNSRATAVRASMRQYHRTFGSKLSAITAHASERRDTKQVSVRLPTVDRKLAKRLVNWSVYETRNRLYRTAVRHYVNVLDELPDKKGWEQPVIESRRAVENCRGIVMEGGD